MRLTVIGAGQMGGGIAYTAATRAKLDVLLYDSQSTSISKQLGLFGKLLDKDIAKGKLQPEDRARVLQRIQTTGDLKETYKSDFIIEAIPEQLPLKIALFNTLSANISTDAVIATNTSSLSITKLSAHYKDPSKVIGMHFMNPVPVMQLVEVIRGLHTSDSVYAQCRALAGELGKTVADAPDTPGFIANRLLMPYLNEGVNVLFESGWKPLSQESSMPASIDSTMELGTNMPMGPLKLADFIGLDTCLSIMRVLQEGFGDCKYRPSPLLLQMVEAGLLGKKVGKGFYVY